MHCYDALFLSFRQFSHPQEITFNAPLNHPLVVHLFIYLFFNFFKLKKMQVTYYKLIVLRKEYLITHKYEN